MRFPDYLIVPSGIPITMIEKETRYISCNILITILSNEFTSRFVVSEIQRRLGKER